MKSIMENNTNQPAGDAPVPASTTSETPQNAPVMDVVPPVATGNSGPSTVEPEPVAEQPSSIAAQPETTVPEKAAAKTQKPGPTPGKPHTAPVVAITLAVLAFVVLAGLAYYAYLQG